ncbi:hypothetical protein SAMN06314019_1112 [Epsilonproteobacteria bacterium SCGC AD-311-C15]|nr:hypothetical protein SAMN06314019_1112 [Epsilonproteobacteria bacterium SCGC AD-311-C15]
MRKYSLLIIFVLMLNTTVYAGENSQATLGDIKEAVYKLIIMGKENKASSAVIDKRVEDIELSSKDILDASKKEKDEYDLLIDSFVQDNKNILAQIEKK